MGNFAKEETLFSAVEMFEARYDYADVILLGLENGRIN